MSPSAQDLLAVGFPVGPCPRCEREVLAVVAPGSSVEGEAWACSRCEGPVRGVSFVDESDLGGLGYELDDPLAGPGCASGCGAGGCATRPRAAAPASLDEMLDRHARLRR